MESGAAGGGLRPAATPIVDVAAREHQFGFLADALFILCAIAILASAWREVVALPVDRLIGSQDNAIAQIAISESQGFSRSLGAFSNNGFNHLGPVMFYLVGALSAVLPGDWLETTTIAHAILVVSALSAAYVVVRRTWGWRAGVVGFAVSVLVTSRLPHSVIGTPWNPNPAPILCYLGIVSAAAFWVRGGLVRFGLALASLSLAAQTHISTAPVLAACGAAIAIRIMSGRSNLALRSRWAAALAGVLGIIWLPPLAHELSGGPSNLARVAETFAGSGSMAGLSNGLRVALRSSFSITAFDPLAGKNALVNFYTSTAWDRGGIAIAVLVGVVALLLGFWWSISRRVENAGWVLLVFASSVFGVGVVSISRIGGPPAQLQLFQTWFLAYLPVVFMVGSFVLIQCWNGRVADVLAVVAAAMAVMATGVIVDSPESVVQDTVAVFGNQFAPCNEAAFIIAKRSQHRPVVLIDPIGPTGYPSGDPAIYRLAVVLDTVHDVPVVFSRRDTAFSFQTQKQWDGSESYGVMLFPQATPEPAPGWEATAPRLGPLERVSLSNGYVLLMGPVLGAT